MLQTWRKWLGIAILLALAVISCRRIFLRQFEPKFLTTGPNGPQTPGSLGVAYQRVKIPSHTRTLDAYAVVAPASCQPKVALLIFHGVQETISEWVKAQRFLYDHCVSSVVFDYSGHGDSSRPGTIQNLNQDALAAYSWFASWAGDGTQLSILGHSMGNGPMLEALRSFRPAPASVVVANAFSSLRDEGKQSRSLRGPLRLLLYIMPDEWNNVRNVSQNRVPLLLVHSDADSVNPIAMGRRIFEAAPQPKQMIVLHGFKHNALYKDPNERWWLPILQFLRGESPDHNRKT